MSDPQKPNEPVKPLETSPETSGQEAAPLSKEEQWALFEKELKESDWGHQPC